MKKESKRRLLSGKVLSDKMDKTILVSVDITYRHPRFGKILRKTKKYKVHDEEQRAKPGDVVEFYETRPLSKTKYMRLSSVLGQNLSSQTGEKTS